MPKGGLARWALIAGLTAAVGCARETPRPTSQISTCETEAIRVAHQFKEPVDVRCDFGKTLWLAALPNQQLTVEGLTAAGVPEMVAPRIAQRTPIRSQWCTIERHDPASSPKDVPPAKGVSDPGFDLSCIDATLNIPTVTVSLSDRFLLRVADSPSQTVRLVRLADFR